LNDVRGLQLPVHGIADAATRGAIRSFQQREGLPTDGIVGPDTERALLAARSGNQGAAGSPMPTEPAAPATELSFESENFAFEFDNAQARRRRLNRRERRLAAKSRPAFDNRFSEAHPVGTCDEQTPEFQSRTVRNRIGNRSRIAEAQV
jgi:hypothetical protein